MNWWERDPFGDISTAMPMDTEKITNFMLSLAITVRQWFWPKNITDFLQKHIMNFRATECIAIDDIWHHEPSCKHRTEGRRRKESVCKKNLRREASRQRKYLKISPFQMQKFSLWCHDGWRFLCTLPNWADPAKQQLLCAPTELPKS